MNDMYSSGLPYSDEIYHHGIPGQKWGVRRFQNPDGSLTSEGRKRYSKGGGERTTKVQKTGSHKSGKDFVKGAAAVSVKAASRLGEGVARGVKTKLAEKMPFMLNDEELEKYRDRLRRENTYRSEMANRRELKRRAQGDQFAKKLIQDVASTSLKTIANKATNKLADELLKTATDRQKEQLELEAKELKNEQEREKASRAKLNTEMNEDIQEAREAYEEKAKNEIAKEDAASNRKKYYDDISKLYDEQKKLYKERTADTYNDVSKKIDKNAKKIDKLTDKIADCYRQEKKYEEFADKYDKIMKQKMKSLTDTKSKVEELNKGNNQQFNQDEFAKKIVEKLKKELSDDD